MPPPGPHRRGSGSTASSPRASVCPARAPFPASRARVARISGAGRPVGLESRAICADPRREDRNGTSNRRSERVLDLDQLLAYAVERGASDVHLKVGSPPFIRIDGRLERIEHASVSQVETERIAFAIMPKQRAEEFIATSDADFAYSVSGVGRFRVNVMRQRGSVGLVLRRVEIDIPSFEALGLPPVVRKLAEHERGLVLVTGPTGSGKTTTLGSMIDYINETQHKHIVTIEHPIELLPADKSSIVNQREFGPYPADFNAALKHVLRQDPDVIL